MLRILSIICICFVVVSCGKNAQEENTPGTPQDIVKVSAPGQDSHKEISLGGTGGVSHEVEFIGEKGKPENIDIAVPKGFSLKTVIVPGGTQEKKTLSTSKKQTGSKNTNIAVSPDSIVPNSNTLNTSSNTSSSQGVKNETSFPETSLGINENSLSTSISDINGKNNTTPLPTSTPQEEKTFFAKVLDFIPGFSTDTSNSEQRVANNGIQTPVSTNTPSSQIPGDTSQDEGVGSNQDSGVQTGTSSETNTDISQGQTNTGTQTGTGTSPSGDSQTSDGDETSTGEGQSGTGSTSDSETQIITEEIVDSNLPDLSNYPITSQSGSIYVFTDDARGMGIIISLHNRGSYGTAEELINPTLLELGGLSREDLTPGTITNTHNYPKFDVRSVIDTPEESKIYYLRFYDFGKILVYIGAYTIPEKLEENEGLMKSIIDTFLWNEEF